MGKSKDKYKAKYSKTYNKKSLVVRGGFDIDTAKWHILAIIILFHILPLAMLIMGETGRQILSTIFMVYLNPILIFVVMLIYGMRMGFNFKMPIICTLLAAASIAMYYTTPSQEDYLFYTIQSTVVMFIVYGFISYISTALGAFIKHYLS